MSPRTTVKDQIAVLHIMPEDPIKDKIPVHMSVPFISTVQHLRFPYRRLPVELHYKEGISRHVFALRKDIKSPAIHSRPLTVEDYANLKNLKKEEPEEEIRYRDVLVNCGREITRGLDMDPVIGFLFSLQDDVQLLQICTRESEMDIPWDWIYDSKKDRLLCEVFGVGVTLTEEVNFNCVLHARHDSSPSAEDLRNQRYSALVIGNRYLGKDYVLQGMDQHIRELGVVIRRTFGAKSGKVLYDAPLHEVTAELSRRSDALRLIYMCGAFESDVPGFRTADNKLLTQHTISDLFSAIGPEAMVAQPLVVLNGCCSGRYDPASASSSQTEANRTLAKKFLDHGAGACVITSTDCRLKHASRFMKSFFENLLMPGTTVGSSLLRARNSMDKQKTYEWAAYHLLGDPSYVMVGGEEGSS